MNSEEVEEAHYLNIMWTVPYDLNLKYAYHDGTTWRSHVVSELEDVGRYNAIAMDGTFPRIATFMRKGIVPDGTAEVSALLLFEATVGAPRSADEWNVRVVDSAPYVPPPCNGSCDSGESCTDDGAPTVIVHTLLVPMYTGTTPM